MTNYKRNNLEALVCIGGGGTQKSALRLIEKGLNVITLPKTIDNDVALTDATIGFDTALGIATEAVDRLHSTAHSHHRIVIAEIMGHRAGDSGSGADNDLGNGNHHLSTLFHTGHAVINQFGTYSLPSHYLH